MNSARLAHGRLISQFDTAAAPSLHSPVTARIDTLAERLDTLLTQVHIGLPFVRERRPSSAAESRRPSHSKHASRPAARKMVQLMILVRIIFCLKSVHILIKSLSAVYTIGPRRQSLHCKPHSVKLTLCRGEHTGPTNERNGKDNQPNREKVKQ